MKYIIFILCNGPRSTVSVPVQEIIHAKTEKFGKAGTVLVEIDLVKAYDSIESGYIL